MVWQGREAVKTGRSTSIGYDSEDKHSLIRLQLFWEPPTHWLLPQAQFVVTSPSYVILMPSFLYTLLMSS